MMDITILAIGKIKENYFAQGILEYEKRLKPYARINTIELKPFSFNENNIEKAVQTEGERIESYLRKAKEKFIIALDENGRQFNSLEFSRFLDRVEGGMIFIIGGSAGIAESIKNQANFLLSLSALTFPHELARLVLIEQLYRSAMINIGKTYHY